MTSAKIVIAGGSGFLGSALSRTLTRDGHNVSVLTRSATSKPTSESRRSFVQWTPDGTAGAWATTVNGADVVVSARTAEQLAG